MTMLKPTLLLPGLGDHQERFAAVLPFFLWHGLSPQIMPAHWQRDDGDARTRIDAGLRWIDAQPRNKLLYGAGTSAGGALLALLYLLRPGRFGRIAVLSAPLTVTHHSDNMVLNAVLPRLQEELAVASPEVVARIGSFFGQEDTVVSIELSMLKGTKWFRGGYGHSHNLNIAYWLTAGSGVLADWLQRGTHPR